MSSENQITTMQAKILRELLVDGRKSQVEIAKKIRVSKEIIRQNCLEMERRNIIRGATIHFNYRGFGYFAVAYMLVTVDPAQADQMISEVGKMQDIYAVYKSGARGSLRVVASIKNLKQLDEIKDTLKQRFSISSIRTVMWTDVKEMHQNLVLAPNDERPEENQSTTGTNATAEKRPKNKVKFDEVDLKIVAALSADGLAAFSRIAENIGVSSSTVKKRYEKLTHSGMIKVTIQINPVKIGYNALAVFFVTFTHQTDSSSIVKKISAIPDVISIMKTSGDYDLQVYVMIRNINQLLQVQGKFSDMQGIAKTEMDINGLLEKWPTPRQYISTF
jgi:DNA-binding Lrp family transcriptional regulator